MRLRLVGLGQGFRTTAQIMSVADNHLGDKRSGLSDLTASTQSLPSPGFCLLPVKTDTKSAGRPEIEATPRPAPHQ